MQFESRLIPIMREGVEVIKMIFFRKLKTYLSGKYPDWQTADINKLSGAIINDLFGTPNPERSFSAFAEEYKGRIQEEMNNIATEFEEMRIPLSDALRVQFLCDHQEGMDSSASLFRAEELDILLLDREVPLPAHFMSMVRRLGSVFGLLSQQ